MASCGIINYHYLKKRMIGCMLSHGHQILAGKICINLETFSSHILALLIEHCIFCQCNIQLCTALVIINSSTILFCSQRNVIFYLIV
jgi:hypothetical protein